MKPENAIEVKDVTKKFRVYFDKGHTLKEKTLFRNRRSYEERTVLDGISFTVKKGEAAGLIGHNGCGKSTTLKLLTKIMYPDSGTIEMSGRVSSLIELGAGFHPDMSGRENIYINASIFGLTKREIDARAGEIITFSELEEFIDNPVRTYSSGMYMRLAFAVAINVKADILLIDEILAVGDTNFQAKCFEKLREMKRDGTTIVIVSHSLAQIEQICDRSVWIDKGVVQKEGRPRDVHPVYMDYMSQKRRDRVEQETASGQEMEEKKKAEEKKKTEERKEAEEKKKKEERKKTEGKKKTEELKEPEQEARVQGPVREVGGLDVRIVKCGLLDENGRKAVVYTIGSAMILRAEYECRNEHIKESVFGFHIFKSDGTDCYGTNTLIDKLQNIRLRKRGTVEVVFPSVMLLQGNYKMDIALHDEDGTAYHYLYDAVSFEMVSPYTETGICRIGHEWKTENDHIRTESDKGIAKNDQ